MKDLNKSSTKYNKTYCLFIRRIFFKKIAVNAGIEPTTNHPTRGCSIAPSILHISIRLWLVRPTNLLTFYYFYNH